MAINLGDQSGPDPAVLDEIRRLTFVSALPSEGVRFVFRSDAEARERLIEVRWPDGPICPRCGSGNVLDLSTRPVMKCRACKHQFTETTGTLLHRSRISPYLWFIATEAIIRSGRRLYRLGGPSHEYIQLQDLACLLGVQHEAACRVRAVVLRDLSRDGAGLLGRCVGVDPVPVPEDIELGSADHLQWLEHRWARAYQSRW